jgi:SAM-dependent methyltransferase
MRRRHYGDADLNGWIVRHAPDMVLCGHVHQSPFADEAVVDPPGRARRVTRTQPPVQSVRFVDGFRTSELGRPGVRDFQTELEALEGLGRTHPSELFRDVDDAFWLWIHTEGRQTSPALAAVLPGLPSPEVQQHWTGKSGTATLVEGFDIYRTMRDLHTRHAGSLREHGPVLDFGCGWGRVIRYFVKDVASDHLLGTDYSEELIEFCLTSDRWSKFTRNQASPPLPIGDHNVGFIYAYSVFSHFSEPMHMRWLEELKRVLRPGGLLALTIRPRSFIEGCQQLRMTEDKGVRRTQSRMFLDADSALGDYDRGDFCFSPYDPSLDGAWWGEACIPRQYIEQRWSRLFDVVDFVSATPPPLERLGRRLGRHTRHRPLQHVVLLRG